MSVTLQKGHKVSLVKDAGEALTHIVMGLGWDAKKGLLGSNIDLDASCLFFDEMNRMVDTVWFRRLRSKDGSVRHSGDNLTGKGDGDDEQIIIDLTAVPESVKSLVFTVSNYTGQDFSRVQNAFCRLVDAGSSQEFARYDLGCHGSHNAMIMAKVYRHNGGWKMHAIGEPGSGRTFEALLPQILPLL